MLIDRKAGRLNDENIRAANVFQQLEVNLTIGKPLHARFAQRHSHKLADLFGKSLVGFAGEDLEALGFAQPAESFFLGWSLRGASADLGDLSHRGQARRGIGLRDAISGRLLCFLAHLFVAR
jgi:hypothetical protein